MRFGHHPTKHRGGPELQCSCLLEGIEPNMCIKNCPRRFLMFSSSFGFGHVVHTSNRRPQKPHGCSPTDLASLSWSNLGFPLLVPATATAFHRFRRRKTTGARIDERQLYPPNGSVPYSAKPLVEAESSRATTDRGR